MSAWERPLTCKEVGDRAGLSAEYVRAACHRGKGLHPLPHTTSGEKRPVIRIRWSTFERWYEEEELLRA
ncbi:MAG: hypothetical protein HFJ75_07555 [Eggerthellaceae bacterium]|nr:hypothetical protein [Eggerthellaceae bacterium]